jgi:uncharacterized protein YdhG (YjbR/CyaY superfamily)
MAQQQSPAQAIYRRSPEPQRTTMLLMRERILKIIPDATEVVSYGMPAFKIDGTIVAGMLANNKHVGYYPFSGSTLGRLQPELQKYSKTKSALHVPIDKPLSVALLRKLIATRRSEIDTDEWRHLGIAAPARRALDGAGLRRLRDLTKWREAEIAALHGMGPNAISTLRDALKKKRLAFKR